MKCLWLGQAAGGTAPGAPSGTQPSRVPCWPNMETPPHTCLYNKQVGPTLNIHVGPVDDL